MPKEDRSDWVAVAPDSTAATTNEIRKPLTAFQYFQKHCGPEIRAQLGGQFDVAAFTKACHARWKELSDDDRTPFLQMAGKDLDRYNQESHEADVAALQRQERLQKERDSLMLFEDESSSKGKRTTRGGWERQKRKKRRQGRKKKSSDGGGNDDDEEDDDDDYSGSDEWDSEQESDDNEEGRPKKKKETKRKSPARPMSQKQIEYQEKKRKDKEDKESYIFERQQDLRKEKAAQAQRRLEFLLQQSNIFSHFGSVKEDNAKYGIKGQGTKSLDNSTTASSGTTPGGRRQQDGEEEEAAALEEADEHEATFLTQQPSTLGYGTMRPYQLEGLNWMIRLQENGVNGICK